MTLSMYACSDQSNSFLSIYKLARTGCYCRIRPFSSLTNIPLLIDTAMRDTSLQKIIQALLFSTTEPLTIKMIQSVIERFNDEEAKQETGEEDASPSSLFFTATQIRETIETLNDMFAERGDVFRLIEGPQGYFLAVNPEYADWIRLLRGEPRPQRLSQAALETLALIAYRQPVTRAEIEAIRGVSADNSLSRLTERQLIAIAGRAELPGRPIQYCTTERFLEYCGIRSIEELPESDVIAPHQLDAFIKEVTQPEKPLRDSDMGLPEEKESNGNTTTT